ncbi:phage portal protein [Bosea sp. TWI1241]|uniref:phage portal protein n=1 Tax=Bosea sp. TWI1241 TaxID=3148904 RepID=UPI00320B2558
MALLDAYGLPVRAQAPGRDRPHVAASRTHPDLAGWRPPRVAGRAAVAWDRGEVNARVHDLARNDGWASGGVSRVVDSIIGSGWRCSSTPNADLLGITPDAADEIATRIEAIWTDYATDPSNWCDAARRLPVGGLLALAYRHFMWDGEALGVLRWRRSPAPWRTALQIVDPDRLSNPTGQPDSDVLYQGVELGGWGEPLAYHIGVRHPADHAITTSFGRHERIERETAWGRAIVLHHFEPERAGEVRGISRLKTVVKKLRMLGRYDEAELQAAVLNATLAAFLKSDFDHKALLDSLGQMDSSDLAGSMEAYNAARVDYWRDTAIDLPGVKVTSLYTNEDIVFPNAARPAAQFEMFERACLRNIATALGTTYEQLSMDWGQVNYSSARAALLEVWRGFYARQWFFGHGFLAPWFAAVLEEAVDDGRLVLPAGAPSFQEARSAWCQARWIGPGRGWVDPMKEAQAAEKRLQTGISTLERESNEQGHDWQENMKQQARENAYARRHGLPLPHVNRNPPKPAAGEPADSEDELEKVAA